MPLNTDTRSSTGTTFTQGSVDALKARAEDTLARGKSDIADSAHVAGDSLSRDIARLHDDITTIRQSLSQFAARTAQNVSSAAKSQVSEPVSREADTPRFAMNQFG